MFMKMNVRILSLLMFAILAFSPTLLQAQVTTSGINGSVKDKAGNALEGASIEAIHTPSGSKYSAVSLKGGNFFMQGMRIGGPYKVTVTFSGFTPYAIDGISLGLGEPYNLEVAMQQGGTELQVVTVSGTRRRTQVDRTGAATSIGQKEITTMPSISRSLTDFTRLTPQSNGTSFGGRDNRYNNVQVDGANFNNNFGLSSDLGPGGGNNPISLDAFEEVSVNIAPYDVRQSGFTGAGINAVTKSGTNTFKGSVYTFYRDQSYNGARVGDVKLGAAQANKGNIYGATIGGPIIKNKLFFFGAYEYEERTSPGVQWSPTGGSGVGNLSSIQADSLKRFSDILSSRYGYETGPYDNFPSFNRKNTKILGRIDWNINKVHKLTLKYNEMVSNNDVAVNALSTPNGAFTGLQARFGPNGMSFANSNYGFEDIVRMGTIELNSRFGSRFSNQLLGTITKISAIRTSPSEVFPFIDILNANGPNTAANMSAGYEPFSYNNEVVNDVYSIIDNFSYYVGKHTFTAGISYEFQEIGNMFMPGSQSYYVFNSLQDFAENRAPARYSLTYSLVPGKQAIYASQVKVGQLGFYLQDEWNISSKFKLTAGIRYDRVNFPEKPLENPMISSLPLYDREGNITNYRNDLLPNSNYFSPRVGFRYNPNGDKSLIIRGGTGIFAGRIPFVWMTNITQNSGMYQFGAIVNSAADLGRFTFNPDPLFHLNRGDARLPTVAGTAVPSNIVVADPDFKFPSVWRTNIAADKKIGDGWVLTFEGIFGKDINAVIMRNANQKPFDSRYNNNDYRDRFSNNLSTTRRLNNNVTGSAIVLENTSQGYQANLTAQITKQFNKGFYGTLAYTFTAAGDVSANPGSTANSVWNVNSAINGQNALEMYPSQYAIPHRIVGTVSYRVEFLKKLASTFTLFYEGSAQGTFTYVNGGDVNFDGNSGSDLLYVPKNSSDIIFVNATYNNITYTPAQQAAAFDAYINQDKYLSKRRGMYTERNGAQLPWYHQLDFKFIQDIFTTVGKTKKTKHTIQGTIDIFNFANMLNRDWGIRKLVNQTQILSFVGADAATGNPTYRLNQVNNLLPTATFRDNINISSTWSMQVGLRYIFN
jgi:outer membrane receptor protein involved in Fe transport